MHLIGLFLLLTISFNAWSIKATVRENDDNLSYQFAQLRKAQIKDVRYQLFFELNKDAKGYKSVANLDIQLRTLDRPLSFDLLADKIISLKVNGVEIKKFTKRVGSFDLPVANLKTLMNVEVIFENSYSQKSGGFIRAKDPEDGSEYVYTDFEPYYAHHFFPCFDQPDLKAVFEVRVKAPKDWKVIHNELIKETKEDGLYQLTTFRPTPLISPYLFFLGAGPFVEWTDKYEETPLYLYARKSLSQFVDAKEIFKTTKAGLKFFNEYFHYSYPFSKYGQIFVPEFAWGGMENPGAVTLNERNIFRGPVSLSKYERRDSLILHEMAHMWFGDLVTMEWWNDLWLNESFATYLASLAQSRALRSEATWIDFFNTKAWGYWQDQLVTTHPIETDVPDVRTAKGNFDGITYAKGASALKQLHYYVGENGFQNGLRHYFQTFAFKNTQRKDFIGAIADASKVDLDQWTKKWLQTAGLNQVHVEFICQDGKISDANLRQEPSISQTLSPHRTRIAFYELKNEKLNNYLIEDVIYSDQLTALKTLIGKKCPDFVLPNFDDQDYAHFTLDPHSLGQVKVALRTLPDSLSKNMLWSILGEMVRDQKLPPLAFMDFALSSLEYENDDLLLGGLLGRNSTLRDQYKRYLSSKERENLAPKFEEKVWNRVLTAKPGSSLQMIFFDFYISIAQSSPSQALLKEILLKKAPPRGLTLDQDRRWALITNLSENGDKNALDLIEGELKWDPSTLGKRMAFGARASIPELDLKKRMWKDFFAHKDMSYSTFKEGAHHIHNSNREDLSRPFVKDFFDTVTRFNWKKNDDIVDIYFEELYPHTLCSTSILKMSQKKLKDAKNLTSLAKRSWLEAQDELARCVKVRK